MPRLSSVVPHALRALVLGLPIAAAGLGAEALAASQGSAQPWLTAPALLLYFGLWLPLLALVAGAVVLVWQRVPAALRAGLPAFCTLAGVWLVVVSGLHQRAESFHNRELAGLLVATLTLGLALVSALVAYGLQLTKHRAAPLQLPAWAKPAGWLGAAVITGLCLYWVGANNREGFAQLNPWLLISPSIALLAAIAVVRWEKGRLHLTARAALPLVVLCICCTWLLGSLRPELPRHLLDAGSWGAYGTRLVQAVSDVDRDGYSGLAGGGDCAAFDPAINPAALDVPGDGIDSNCVGGDSPRAEHTKPTWLPFAAAQQWNVVYISIEALRPDHLSLLGYERDTTPQLKQIGQDAFVFERAYSPSTLTRWALPSILSSLPPSRVPFEVPQKKGGKLRLGKPLPWLPSLLQKAGYRTGAIHTNFKTLTKNAGIGLHRGFDRYDAETQLRYRGGSMQGFPGDEQVQRAKALLGDWAERSKPFFLWLHLVEPHFRYDQKPGSPNFGQRDEDRYDSEIWTADKHVGEIYAELTARGLQDKTIFIVTGDHGEEFGEHGKPFHGTNLFDPQTRTLLLMRVPELRGSRIQAAVCLNELGPTLLNLLGLESAFEQMHGRNLMPLLQGANQLDGAFVIELFGGWRHSDYQAATVRWPHKVMWSEAGALTRVFDLAADPDEKRPLPQSAWPGEAQALAQGLQLYLESAAKRGVQP